MADRRHRVVWTESAARDFETILTYIAQESGLLRAQQVQKKIEKNIASLATYPLRARIVPELRAQGVSIYREQLMKPYRIMFRIVGREVVLLAVLDGRRDLEELLIERALDR